MEYFDTFNEAGIFQCSVDEHDVHYKGLWHKVIRVWLYDQDGNIYLRVRKEDNKLDCISEQHLLSSESAVECFDRGMYDKLGIHLPATSEIELAQTRKIRYSKVYSDNTEIKENYFLCDYIGEFDTSTSYFIFGNDTLGIVKINARGVSNFLSKRSGEIIGYDVKPFGDDKSNRRFININDIYDDFKEDLFIKYNFVLATIIRNSAQREKIKREEEKIKRLMAKSKAEQESAYRSHADDNDGDILY